MPYHALVVAHIDRERYRMDAGLCNRRGYQLMHVNPNEETLLTDTKQDGDAHFEIVEDHGYFDAYPQLFVESFLQNIDRWQY
mgnify:CR=1 FL=1